MSFLRGIVAKSELPGAEKFEAWIFEEVLPCIRKTGMYATDELLDNPNLLIAAATKLKEERKARIEAENKVKLLESKGQFYPIASIRNTSTCSSGS